MPLRQLNAYYLDPVKGIFCVLLNNAYIAHKARQKTMEAAVCRVLTFAARALHALEVRRVNIGFELANCF